MGNEVQIIIKRILKDIQVELSDEFDQNFEREAFFSEAWARRKSPTRPDGHILVDTGNLRRSIQSRTTDNSITFFTTEPYAEIHNDGGEIVVTAKMKKYFWHKYYEATGSGFNFKAGVIIRPTDFFRVGLAFHSPTFYTIDQYSDQHMDFDGVNGSRHETEISATSLSYDLQTPLKAQASLGFVIGKRAIIGLEYQFEDYSAIRISDCDGVYSYYDGERLDRWTDHYVDFDKVDEKDRINEVLGVAHTIKLGAEVNVAKGFAVRLGTAFVTKPLTKEAGLDQNFPTDYPVSFPQNTFYVTGGWGYRGESFFVDIVKDDIVDTCIYKCLSNVESNAVRCACYPSVFAF